MYAKDLTLVTPPQPTPTTNFKKGDKVTLAYGANIYGQSGRYQDWVYKSILTVMEDPYKDRVVLSYNSSLVGAVYAKDLTLYKEEEVEIHKGSRVRLKSGTKVFHTNTYLAQWCYSAEFDVIQEPASNGRTVIARDGVVIAAVRKEDLILCSSGKVGMATPNEENCIIEFNTKFIPGDVIKINKNIRRDHTGKRVGFIARHKKFYVFNNEENVIMVGTKKGKLKFILKPDCAEIIIKEVYYEV